MASSVRRERKIKEGLAIRQAAKKAVDDGGLVAHAAKYHNGNNLTFTRQLGHKDDMKGAGQWNLLTGNDKCWICDNHTYTLFFWSRKSGENA
jgi:hypothetical protein